MALDDGLASPLPGALDGSESVRQPTFSTAPILALMIHSGNSDLDALRHTIEQFCIVAGVAVDQFGNTLKIREMPIANLLKFARFLTAITLPLVPLVPAVELTYAAPSPVEPSKSVSSSRPTEAKPK